MQRRQLGKTGLEVSALGFGGAEIGFEAIGATEVKELLAQAIDAGLNVIDTANAYLDSEALIGQALTGRRQDVLLFSKCGATDGFSRHDWSAAGIAAQIDQTLSRLRTDHLDLMQLHSCGIDVLDAGEAIDALRRAREAGKLRFIGYSGDGLAAAHALKLGVFDTLQTSISIADQQPLALTLPQAVDAGVGVIAKRPLANVAWRHAGEPPQSYHHEYWRRLRLLDYPFLRTPLAEVVGTALRFTLSQPAVATAIVGTTRAGRWQQNAAQVALGPLPEADIAAIRARWLEVGGGDWQGQV